MIRIVENHDWVILVVLVIIAMYLALFNGLQRGQSIWEYLRQDYKEIQNLFLCWLGISVGYITVLSVLFSQYIPLVPRFVLNFDIDGFVLNKMGVMFGVLLLFYFVKSVFTALFYKGIGQVQKYLVLGFVAQKFYFLQSLLLMVLCIIHYYFPIDRQGFFIYYLILMVLLFISKITFYIFHKDKPLPREWYYKILYICTLQILPLLAIWKFIFLA